MKVTYSFALALVTLVSSASGAEPVERPNVIIFMIDDLGRADLGIDGSSLHETPRLDTLARSGVRFTDFYSAHPVCSPTRAALMTGKVPQRVGITDWIHPASGVALPAAETTLAESFHAAGYQTAYFGKWHLGESDDDQPGKHGFEWTRGVNRAGAPASYHFPYRRTGQNASIWNVPDLDDGRPGDYLTDVLTGRVIEFLEQRDRDRPFLACVGHYAVHTPIQPPAALPAKYSEKVAGGFGKTETPTVPAPFGSISRGRQDDADYAAMIENLDTNIGRVLDALEHLKLRHNTVVIFTSDNGGLCTLARNRPGPTCNLPWRSGKGWMYEGGIRIPTVISYPGQIPPAVCSVPAYTADLYPTLLELCGLPQRPEQHVDGRSLARVLRGAALDAAIANRPLAWYYPHDHGSGHRPAAAIRQASWKLIHFFGAGQSELYNLSDDPEESVDVSDQHPDRTESLRKALLQWVDTTTQKAADRNDSGESSGQVEAQEAR